MDTEATKGINFGILLVIVAAIIGLAIMVFVIGKNTANRGLTSTVDALATADKSEFSDFDQTTVVGTRLLSAFKSVETKKVTILVATQAAKDHTDSTKLPTTAGTVIGTTALTGSLLDATAAMGDHTSPIFAVAVTKPEPSKLITNSKVLMWRKSNQTAIGAVFVQYNALLASTDASGVTAGNSGNTLIYWDKNCYRIQGRFRMDADSRVMFENMTVNIDKPGLMEMIPASAKFESYLLYDESGTMMGIVLSQGTN